jgi:3-oxo-5-alpha-steroid 4-dehydrogenase 1
MGKTSLPSILNVPGKSSWIFMELFSPVSLLLAIYTNPTRAGPLPKSHVWLTTLYCMHYFHRALLSPIRNPSMAPVHILLVLTGIVFNIVNGSAIGAWLGGYGNAETVPLWQMIVGSAMFLLGLWGNVYHEEILRDIRGGPKKKEEDKDTVVSPEGRVYKVPRGGLFEYCWYPHVGCFLTRRRRGGERQANRDSTPRSGSSGRDT